MLGIAALAQLALAELPPPPPEGLPLRPAGQIGLGRRRRREIERDPWQRGFTRRNYDELLRLADAQLAAAERAERLKNAKAKRALDAALDAAADAIEQVEREAEHTALITNLTRSLNAAARAETARKVIAEANAVAAAAKRIREEFEDEDDAIMLLLS